MTSAGHCSHPSGNPKRVSHGPQRVFFTAVKITNKSRKERWVYSVVYKNDYIFTLNVRSDLINV